MRILVSVGTDRHPFDRLVGWMDRWAAEHPDDEVFVQYGYTRCPEHADGAEMLPIEEFGSRIESAHCVILQGGPGGIADARSRGKIPIVVPRDPALGEHVDGHQLRFARRLADPESAHVVHDEAELRQLLDEIRTGRAKVEVDPEVYEPPGVSQIADLLATLPAPADTSMPKRLLGLGRRLLGRLGDRGPAVTGPDQPG